MQYRFALREPSGDLHAGSGRVIGVRDFRFSFSAFTCESRETFIQKCRRGEHDGYDTVFAGDHLGAPAPFPLLVEAADATQRLRVGTLVLNTSFWNPALLAREVATTDILTEGRLELGLGAGHMKWEFDDAGIEWQPFTQRAERLSRTITELGRLFTTNYDRLPEGVATPCPLQRRGFGGTGPTLIVGGTGDQILRIAAEHADVVSIGGIYQIKGKAPGTLRLATAAEAHERVRFARQHAGARADDIEWQMLVQMVIETNDRAATARDLVERFGGAMTVDEALQTPFLLIGTVDEMADQLRLHREHYGFSYITVHEPYMQAFAGVIAGLAAR
jgi:probable F420-dependent oxidoreductase